MPFPVPSWTLVHVFKHSSLVQALPIVRATHCALETCQRWIFLGGDQLFQEIQKSLQWQKLKLESRVEILRDDEECPQATCFLLELACGLKSELLGETEIVHQLKQAWKKCLENAAADSEVLVWQPWMEKLFQYTKHIRSRYLQSLGGRSYGSLIRKWLRQERKKRPVEKLLLVGGGHLAQEVFPFLEEFSLFLWNRSFSSWKTWVESQVTRSKTTLFLNSHEAIQQALKEAEVCLFCIPFEKMEGLAQQLFLESLQQPHQTLLHLGLPHKEHFDRVLGKRDQLWSLADLFEFEKSQEQERSIQIQAALEACREQAEKLAYLKKIKYLKKRSIVGEFSSLSRESENGLHTT